LQYGAKIRNRQEVSKEIIEIWRALMAGMQSPEQSARFVRKKVCDVAKQRLPRCNIKWDQKNQFDTPTGRSRPNICAGRSEGGN
jgi:hypothetical protein